MSSRRRKSKRRSASNQIESTDRIMASRYCVGIDLGTTNSVVAFTPLPIEGKTSEPQLQLLPIPQLNKHSRHSPLQFHWRSTGTRKRNTADTTQLTNWGASSLASWT